MCLLFLIMWQRIRPRLQLGHVLAAMWPLPGSLSLGVQHGWPVRGGKHWLAETKKICSKSAEKVSHLTYQNKKEAKERLKQPRRNLNIRYNLDDLPFFFLATYSSLQVGICSCLNLALA